MRTFHWHDLTFLSMEGHGRRAILVLLCDRVVQHIIIDMARNSFDPWEHDISEVSPHIGLTARQVTDDRPYWTEDVWDAAISFLMHVTDLDLWIAGRYNLLKEYTCDHPVYEGTFVGWWEDGSNG